MKRKAEVRLHKPTASASAGASRHAELQRLQRMSMEERILAALSLRDRLAGLRPAPFKK